MCTAFSRLQGINYSKMHPDQVRSTLAHARMHLNFVCSLYEEQIRGGRFFIHEHPTMATSWEEPAIRQLMKMQNVRVTKVDACQYGMVGEYHGQDLPLRKPTKWMSNMRGVTDTLTKTCSGRDGMCSNDMQHATCTGKKGQHRRLFIHCSYARRYSRASSCTFRRKECYMQDVWE